MIKFHPMMAQNLILTRQLAIVGLLVGGLSGCVYDRYIDTSPSSSSKTNSGYSTRSAPVVSSRKPAPVTIPLGFTEPSNYYRELAYREVTVLPGDTLSKIADRQAVPLRSVIALNNAQPPYGIYVGQQIRVPDFRRHQIRKGETLYAISRVYGVQVAEVVHFNRMEPPYTLTPNVRLKIPQTKGAAVQVASVGKSSWVQSNPQTTGQRNVAPIARNQSLAPKGKSVSAVPLKAPTTSQSVLKAPVKVSAVPVQKPKQPKVVASLPPLQKTVLDGSAIPANALPPLPRHRYSIKQPPLRAGKIFEWPAKGPVLSSYGKKDSGLQNDGLNIKLAPGTPIRAAENGVVSYVGNEMRSFGNLILVSHADGFVTTYGHVAEIYVRKGEPVLKGDVIAVSGATGDVNVPQLHFEIRKNGAAKNPTGLLARR
jgi:murein DD-endopeptidase MepM/ murein hydrolase activator NlpD